MGANGLTTLRRLVAKSEKIEMVGIFQDLRGKLGLGTRQLPLEVCDSGPLAKMKLVLDLNLEGIPWPCLLERLASIPVPQNRVGEPRDKDDDVEPGQLVSGLLTNSTIGAFLREKPHVLEVRRGQPLHIRELGVQVR